MNETGRYKIGTRGSRLALIQTRFVEVCLKAKRPDIEIELKIIKTSGEKMPGTSLVEISGQGIFTRELDRALNDGTIDLAVHSLKDLPTQMRPGIALAAVTKREDAGEAFVSNRFARFGDLPPGARIGTGSPRRKAQILVRRPDLSVVDLRGNVETRLRKLDDGEIDAAILACAGLIRLGLEARITERLCCKTFIPAPGQGALGLTVRRGDDTTHSLAACLNDPASAGAVAEERAFLARLGGGCKTPIACHGFLENNRLNLSGFVASTDGRTFFEKTISGSATAGESLGRTLAEKMLKQGAGKLLEEENHDW